MYNGAPYHETKKVQMYIKKVKVTTSEWPGNKPDIKPVMGTYS